MLEIRDLNVAYGQHRALEGACLKVNPGEIVVILGANGAGKSTLLKAISGICEGQVDGSIVLDGHELSGLAPDQIVEEGIALVPEGRGIFGDLTVEENLALGGYPNRAREETSAILSRVFTLFPKLSERKRQIARTMSGGEQQMVAIGRAMMSNPQILTLDEPSLGLSPLLCKELFENLKAVRQAGIGILLVEQNARQSLAISDRGYLLENAHIVHEDSAQNLMHDPAVQAAYLGAGGAASPHTHEDEPSGQKPATPTPSKDRSPAPGSEPPAALNLKPKSMTTQSADDILGTSISDMVASASAKPAPASGEPSTPKGHEGVRDGVSAPSERMQALLSEIETAAERARTARQKRFERPISGSSSLSGTEASAPKSEIKKPVAIEVYRKPRVEIYRRRPGSTSFERD